MKILSKVASAIILSTGLLIASSYSVDNAHSNVGFTVKHMMVTNVHGKFTSYDAKVEFLEFLGFNPDDKFIKGEELQEKTAEAYASE